MKSLFATLSFCLLVCCGSGKGAKPEEILPPPGEKTPYPSLFFTTDDVEAIRARANSTDWLKKMRQTLIGEADTYLTLSVNPYPLVDPANGVGSGTCARALQARTQMLAMAGYLTGQQRYFNKAKEILLWVVRNKQPGMIDEGGFWNTHLQVGDAAQAFAIGYDLLYPVMSEAERAEVLAMMQAMGQSLIDNPQGSKASDFSCNHTSVHYGGLGLCALILGRQEWLNLATERTRQFLTYCGDTDGYITESLHYASYGLGGAMPFAYALKRAKGTDLLADAENLISKAGDQLVWKIQPAANLSVTLNDDNEGRLEPSIILGALMHDKPVQLWAWLRDITDKNGNYTQSFLGLTSTRMFLFLAGDGNLVPQAPTVENTGLGKHFSSGRVFLRSGWGDENDAHVSVTSGYDMHHGHNHQDENSVTFFALGEGFLIDPQYNPMFSYCHTTLKINGEEQWIAMGSGSQTVGQIEQYREDTHGALVKAEAKGAYTSDKNIAKNQRKLYFVRNLDNGRTPYLIWRDDAAMNDSRSVEFETRFITYPDNIIAAKGDGVVITGGKSGAKALLVTYSGAEPVVVREENLAGKKFTRKETDYPYLNYLRRISGRVTASNPRFTTLVIPFRVDTELPTVAVSESGDDIIYTLAYPDGGADKITLSSSDITLLRQ